MLKRNQESKICTLSVTSTYAGWFPNRNYLNKHVLFNLEAKTMLTKMSVITKNQAQQVMN